MMKAKSLYPAVFFIVSAIFFLSWIGFEREDKATSNSTTASGLRTYVEMIKNLPDIQVISIKKPLLKIEDVEQVDTLLMFGIRKTPSPAQLNLIYNYISSGGTLFISIANETQKKILLPLLHRFSINSDLEIEVDPNFINKKTQRVFVEENDQRHLFFPASQVEFYSLYTFSSEENCSSQKTLKCYYKVFQKGSGSIHVFLGTPPLSNALIWRSENRLAAFNLTRQFPRQYIDEYHHFLSEKTFRDFLLDFKFSLPLFLLFLGTFLFLLLAKNVNKLEWLSQKPQKNYFDINEEFLLYYLKLNKISNDSLIEQYSHHLHLQFPQSSALIRQKIQPLKHKKMDSKPTEIIKLFTDIHKQLIQERRGESP